jgi:hypothetical protein
VLHDMTKYVFVTGGVVSSLGKGIASASLAAILESRGLKADEAHEQLHLGPDLQERAREGASR